MKYLSKPWLIALSVAVLLHILVFVELKDQDWGITSPKERYITPQLNVELLKSSSGSIPSSDSDTDVFEPEQPAAPAPAQKPTSVEEVLDSDSASATIEPATIKPATEEDTTSPQNATEEESATAPTSTPQATVDNNQNQPPVTLDDIQQADTLPEESALDSYSIAPPADDWKQSSLLDIGDKPYDSEKADPTIDAFSPTFRAQLKQAIKDQKAYKKGLVKPKTYDITEDADGTKYVNINGVCWKLPDPDSEEEWQVVLSGCAGQKDTFRFELNISTDLLTPEQMELLPFGGTE
ncbi:hypothetical protein DN730_18475 [Marinomonas piezotolerans]|uniref:DUF930 domain-containing protein n=1 Tax=Marinomonas piezotolerans TaxID=2213058 RepID=A0A370U4I0_9GAMM|nr:hypothetical protein [Marinomonas piezotolerans]RDL42691.1 hypothetical protein DN730_18475 [Marinomonas piezotolerans]